MRNGSGIRHADFRVLDATMDQRRFTYNNDVLWILNHLSQHGKILKLKLGFCGRRNVRMLTRDGEFLNALKGVKTDKLEIGDPKPEVANSFDVRLSQSLFSVPIRTSPTPESLVRLMLTRDFLTGCLP